MRELHTSDACVRRPRPPRLGEENQGGLIKEEERHERHRETRPPRLAEENQGGRIKEEETCFHREKEKSNDVRGMRRDAGKLRASVRSEDALVLLLREEAGRGCGRHQQDVRGLRADGGKLRVAVRAEEAVVLRLREESRRGGER